MFTNRNKKLKMALRKSVFSRIEISYPYVQYYFLEMNRLTPRAVFSVILATLVFFGCIPVNRGPLLPSPTSVPSPTPTCEGPSFIVGASPSQEELNEMIQSLERQGYTVTLKVISGEEIANELFPCGDIPGDVPVPIYPGAVQSHDLIPFPSDKIPITFNINVKALRNYLTTASPDQILSWYEQTLPGAGFEYQKDVERGVLFFYAGNWHYVLFVTTYNDKNYIFILAEYRELPTSR